MSEPIGTAPETGDFFAYNPMTGWYRTRFVEGEFPLGEWGRHKGQWYPRPTHWMRLPPGRDASRPWLFEGEDGTRVNKQAETLDLMITSPEITELDNARLAAHWKNKT